MMDEGPPISRMEGQDAAEAVLGRLSVSTYGSYWIRGLYDVIEFRLYKSDDLDDGTILDMLMETEGRTPNYRVILRFGGVSQLRLASEESFGGGTAKAVGRISGLDIKDISDRQWEGIRWDIGDYEDSAISFYACT